MNKIRSALIVAFAVLFVSCTSVDHLAVPSDFVNSVAVANIAELRTWADEVSGDRDALVSTYAEVFRPYNEANGRRFDILALSGGGQSGAWGAGILNGWSATGKRPVFDVVTGISTGAIIAPFAFLGSQYDPVLKQIYTETTSKDIGRPDVVAALTTSDGVLNVGGFEKLLSTHVTDNLVAQIANEARKGRMLLIGTTNLEAERGVIWNIGILAMSDYALKKELLRDIIRASASIPGAFPPVQIKVDHQNERFEELHVDGGVTEQVFLYPANISIRTLEKSLGYKLKKRVFVVRNAKLEPTFNAVEAKTVKIVERSINTLIKVQGRSDVRRIERIADRDGIEFYLSSIPASFSQVSKQFFDPNYMRPLFALGEASGASEEPWQRSAP